MIGRGVASFSDHREVGRPKSLERTRLEASQSDEEVRSHVKKGRGRGRGATYSRKTQSNRNSPDAIRPGVPRSNVSSPGVRLNGAGNTEMKNGDSNKHDMTEESIDSRFDDDESLKSDADTAPSEKGDGNKAMESDVSTTQSEASAALALNRAKYDIIVTRVIDPFNIWAQVGVDGSLEDFKDMDKGIDVYCKDEELQTPDIERIDLHQIVLAHSSKTEKWHRARVVRVDSEVEEVDVYFVDYGENEVVTLEQIRTPIPLRYSQQPPLAHMCRLNAIQPLASTWIRRATEQFKTLVLEKQAKAAFCNHMNTLYVDIFVSVNDQMSSVAQCLINDEVAMPGEDHISAYADLNRADATDDDIKTDIYSDSSVANDAPKPREVIFKSKVPKFEFKKKIPKERKHKESPKLTDDDDTEEVSLEAQLMFGDLLNLKHKPDDVKHDTGNRCLVEKIEQEMQLAKVKGKGFPKSIIPQDLDFHRTSDDKEPAPSGSQTIEQEEPEIVKALRKKLRQVGEMEIPRLIKREIHFIEEGLEGDGLEIGDVLSERDVNNLVHQLIIKAVNDGNIGHLTLRLMKLLYGHKDCNIGSAINELTNKYIKVSKRPIQKDKCYNLVHFIGQLFINSARWDYGSLNSNNIHLTISQVIQKWFIFKKGTTEPCETLELYLICLTKIMLYIGPLFGSFYPDIMKEMTEEVKHRILDKVVSRDTRSKLIDMLMQIGNRGGGVSVNKPEVRDQEVQCNDAVYDVEELFEDEITEAQPGYEAIHKMLIDLKLISLYAKFMKWGLDDKTLSRGSLDLQQLMTTCGFSYLQTENIVKYVKDNLRVEPVVEEPRSQKHPFQSDSEGEAVLDESPDNDWPRVVCKKPTTLRGIGELLSAETSPSQGVVTRAVDRCAVDSEKTDLQEEFPPLSAVPAKGIKECQFSYSAALKHQEKKIASYPNSPRNSIQPKTPASSMVQNKFDHDYEDANLSFVSSDSANKLYSEMMKLYSQRHRQLSGGRSKKVYRSLKDDNSGINLITDLVSDENQNRIYDQNPMVTTPGTIPSNQTASATLHELGLRLAQSSTATEDARRDWWSDSDNDRMSTPQPGRSNRDENWRRGSDENGASYHAEPENSNGRIKQKANESTSQTVVETNGKLGEYSKRPIEVWNKKAETSDISVSKKPDKSSELIKSKKEQEKKEALDDWWEAESPAKRIDKGSAKSLISGWLNPKGESKSEVVSSTVVDESFNVVKEATKQEPERTEAGGDDVPDTWELAVDDDDADVTKNDDIYEFKIDDANGNDEMDDEDLINEVNEIIDDNDDDDVVVDEETVDEVIEETLEESFIESDNEHVSLVIHDKTANEPNSGVRSVVMETTLPPVRNNHSFGKIVVEPPKVFTGFDTRYCSVCGGSGHNSTDCQKVADSLLF